jgi:hypothetical protein
MIFEWLQISANDLVLDRWAANKTTNKQFAMFPARFLALALGHLQVNICI